MSYFVKQKQTAANADGKYPSHRHLPQGGQYGAYTKRQGHFDKADKMLAAAMKKSGYIGERSYPLPLAEFNLVFSDQHGFSDYLRAVNMETGEISTQYKENGIWVKQDLFVSRADDLIIMRIHPSPVIMECKRRSGNDTIFS